ncbi:hypothetical protein [Nannocystis punicea]|uniref:Lipoprotein n=1 Tax=Nannocystis punicea TaxID=2995304 RepID=A0ABY7GUH7_9BACT|nr:hypothetical protein [Nannocystis poenicansa]WAS90602.1 hypothetical protein O0S08_30820 [Nannocystis poenicansa]
MRKNLHRYLFAFAFVSGAGLAACGDDSSGATNLEIAASCNSYCDKARECNDDVSDDCVDDCKSRIGDCMADEQRETLDDLDSCASDACGEFAACTVGAGLQCTFGL